MKDAPSQIRAFTEFANFERDVGELARARAIYDLGVEQPVLDKPDLLWKAYIDFEIWLEDRKRRREELEDDDDDDVETDDDSRRRVADLYERLLEKTKHVKVWISFAKYELEAGDAGRARKVWQRADDFLKHDGTKDDRVVLREAWLAAEMRTAGPDGGPAVDAVKAKLPRKIKKRRPRPDDDSVYEDYFDYVFPDDPQTAPLNLKLLEAARKWKAEQLAKQALQENPGASGDDDRDHQLPPSSPNNKRPRLGE
mmetsp:Transcript_14354/g.43464  ORF Transcript_14354/g.43464 Transcript_14354/m.43464 type:complete len:254 (+) Transcript_14354:164-925(+)